MPRTSRVDIGDHVYHVINRANGRLSIFNGKDDYELFERLLEESRELMDMRVLAYVIMPNHWHMLLHPKKDKDLSLFIHRLSNAHTRKVHALTRTNGSGHLYQGRYKSFLVDSDTYLLTLIKYIERNPVRAKLTAKPQDWKWGSAWRRINGTSNEKKLLAPSPVPIPHGYTKWINISDKPADLSSIRTSVNKGVPFGKDRWVDQMVAKYGLESTLRSPGRPRNN